jgi:large subunit ribosomal protein L4
MATVEVKDTAGKKVGEQTLADAVFGIEPKGDVVHQVVRGQLAARRAGTHSTKGRSEVRGGGRKPYRQKGTGRARAGTIRSPLWRGGGVVFGPQQRDHGFKVPRKMVKLAMRSVLSAKAAEGSLHVVEGFAFDAPSTKRARQTLEALGIQGRVTVVVDNGNENAIKSFRNLERVRAIEAEDANTYDLVNNGALVLAKPAVEWLEGVLS